jgi:thiol-disulfide isomerase/thioredoxin
MNKSLHLSILFLLTFSTSGFCQKKFSLVIIADSTINTKYLSCIIDNGKKDIQYCPKLDTFKNGVLIITDSFFSEKATVRIRGYKLGNLDELFIDDKHCTVYLSTMQDADGRKLVLKKVKNAVIYNTETPFFKELGEYINAERNANADFHKKYGLSFQKNDSLNKIRLSLYKKTDLKIVEFIKLRKDEYLAFWNFCRILSYSTSEFKDDTVYLKELKYDFYTIFPTKFTNSFEGERILKSLNEVLEPTKKLGINDSAPYFEVTNLQAKQLKSTDYKGKYLLLHFWATWCVPCKAQMPKLVNFYKMYDKNIINIVSICNASILWNMKLDVKKYGFAWNNVFDKSGDVSNLFQQSAVPTYILIDPKGIIKVISHDIVDVQNLKLN